MDKVDFLFINVNIGTLPLKVSNKIPPLGVLSIASFLEENGYRSRVVDTSRPFFSISWLKNYLASTTPRYIGFTLYTDYLRNIKRLISIIRNVSPASILVCGGPHASICDKSTLSELDVEIVVRGNGEVPSLELLSGKRLSEITGISYLIKGSYQKNADSPSHSLDAFPSPDLSLIEPDSGFEYAPAIATGRGCPFRCSFCAAGTLSPRAVFRPMDLLEKDIIKLLPRCKREILVVVDDTFTVNPSRVLEFCSMIKKIGGGKKFVWYAEGNVNSIKKNPEILSEMYDSGLRFLQFGIESGDPSVLKAYNKEVDLDYAVDLIRECARLGIFMHTNFIIGGPFESDETIARTRAYAKKLIAAGSGYLNMAFPYLTPLPGTDIFNNPEKYGLKILDKDLLSSFAFNNAVVESSALSRSEIIWHRFNIMLDLLEEIFAMMKSPNPVRNKRCVEASSLAGSFHPTVVADNYVDWNDYFVSGWKGVFAKLPEYHQFLGSGVEPFEQLIPIRASAVVVNGDGNIDFPHFADELSPIQSRVLDLSAGKLTAEEIAFQLGESFLAVKDALIALEKIGAIIYGTF